jgi:hypothetical protein
MCVLMHALGDASAHMACAVPMNNELRVCVRACSSQHHVDTDDWAAVCDWMCWCAAGVVTVVWLCGTAVQAF